MLLKLLLFLLFSPWLFAQFGLPQAELRASTSVTSIQPGKRFQLILEIPHPPGYHSYYRNPGSIGSSLAVTWDLPAGMEVSEMRFPVPERFETPQGERSVISYGYSGTVRFLFDLTAPKNLSSGQVLPLAGKANWLICNESTCVPRQATFEIPLPLSETTTLNSAAQPILRQASSSLPAPASSWKIEAEVEEDQIWLHATPPAGLDAGEPFYFFSSNGMVDAQAEQAWDVEGRKITLYLDPNQGNAPLGIKPGPIDQPLTGILTYQTPDGSPGAIQIGRDDLSSEVAEEKADLAEASETEREAGAALYDPKAKPDFVLLSGEKEEKLTFGKALVLVFLGGLLLNLMPCVFPVLGLKVLGFVQMAGEDEAKIKNHGLIFGLGVLVTMWILASVVIALDFNWGQQLSKPLFLGSIIILLFLMGLNLFGLFEVGTRMTSVGGDLQNRHGYSGSFFSGALTTLIATPCSGPFLGIVMGYALTQPKPVAMGIFTVFALGIASPYILLSFFPAAIKKLPRPGAWMESFKQLMSFAVFATVVFFLQTYLSLVGRGAFTAFLFALVILALAAWIYGRWGTVMTPQRKRHLIGHGLAAGFALAGLWLGLGQAQALTPEEQSSSTSSAFSKPGELVWQEWFPGKMELSRKKKRIAWIDYTADW